MTQLQNILLDETYQFGVAWGGLMLVIAVGIGYWWQQRWLTIAPIGGLLLVGGSIPALVRANIGTSALAQGVAVLACVGLLADLAVNRPGVGLAVAAPGAFLLARDLLAVEPDWVGPLLLVGTVLGGGLAVEHDRRNDADGSGLLLAVITLGGIYLTVPDTEAVLPVLGVATLLVLAAWPLRMVSLGGSGGLAVTGLLLWIGVTGAVGRPSAFVGVVGALGLLIDEPIAALISGRQVVSLTSRHPIVRTGALALIHVVIVLVCTRLGSLGPSVVRAVVVCSAAHGIAIAGLALAARHSGSPIVRPSDRPFTEGLVHR